MQLEDVPKLYSAKAQRIEMSKKPLSFVERFFNLRKTEVRRMDGGGSSKNYKGICNMTLKKDGHSLRPCPFFSQMAFL
ncbi:hypothetical protein THYS13_22630 [Thermoanaerobacter sp. YS13]|nr:hypothetical protein THYS13_22630 [Thermoanaerobacter sp. YS13]